MSTAHHLLPDADEFARMETVLFDRLERGQRRKRVTHRLAAVGIVVVLSGGTVAASTTASSSAQSNQAYCYPTSTTSGTPISSLLPTLHGAKGNDYSARTVAKRVSNAVAACGALWSSGLLSKSSGSTAVPRLQGCITNNQVIAVFPNRKGLDASTFCGSLGLTTR